MSNDVFIEACKSGDISVIERYIREGGDPSDYDNAAIRWASNYGHTEVVKLLLSDRRVDPSDDNNATIRWASKYGHTEVVKLLTNDERVDPSADSNYAIQWASVNGHIDIVKLLLEADRVIMKGIALGQEGVLDYISSERERKIKELV